MFYSFWFYCKWDCFLNFIFKFFKPVYRNPTYVLYTDCVSCDDADFVSEFYFWFCVHVDSMELPTNRIMSSVDEYIFALPF